MSGWRPNAKDEERLLRALCREENPAEMRRLLKDLLSAAEYGTLQRRWAIFELLEAGETQRKTAEAIGGSLCSVTRGARIRREGRSAAIRALRALAAEEKGGSPKEEARRKK